MQKKRKISDGMNLQHVSIRSFIILKPRFKFYNSKIDGYTPKYYEILKLSFIATFKV